MSQVSRGKFGLCYPGGHFELELTEGGSEGGVRRSMVGENGCERWTEETVVSAREEERESQAAPGDLVSVSAWDALNEAVQPETPKVIGDGARSGKTTTQWVQS